MRFGCIYRTKSPENKFYIGSSIHSMRTRRNCHTSNAYNTNSPLYNSKLSQAIRKFGDKMIWEEIHYRIPENILIHLERDEVEAHNAFHNGYNNTSDGRYFGKKHSESWRKEHSKRMTGSNNSFYGRRHAQRTIELISKTKKGRKDSIETRNKKSIARLGRKNPMFGKTREQYIKDAVSLRNTRYYDIINTTTGNHYLVYGRKGIHDFTTKHSAKSGRSLYNNKCFKDFILIR